MSKIFAYHHGNNGISHYRVWQPMKYLAKLGWEVGRVPDRSERVHWDGLSGPCNVPGVPSHQEIVDQNDVIFTNFSADPKEVVRIVCQSKLKPLVLDIDDDILNIDRTMTSYKNWHANDDKKHNIIEVPADEVGSVKWKDMAAKFGGHFAEQDGKTFLIQYVDKPAAAVLEEISAAALVTVSTETLKKRFQPYNKNIAVIPNAVDFDLWPQIKKPSDGLIRIGLFGSNSHYGDWREVAQVLRDILEEFPNVRLVLNAWYIGKGGQGSSLEELEKEVQFPDYMHAHNLIDNVQTEIYEPCEIQDWAQWVADRNIDIALAPLKDTLFNKSKSNLKYLEFSALRIPGVYAHLEPYADDIEHGYNGFLASNPVEYKRYLKKLIQDAELRQTMGNRAYLDVKSRYSQEKISAKLALELNKLLGVKDEKSETETRAAALGISLAR